jgi:hypothetical protein
MISQSTLSTLAAMPDRLEETFRLVPVERHSWTPASWEGIPGERFSPLGQLCHVRDIEVDGYHVRLARMLHEESPDLVSLDSYELAAGRDYDHADPHDALDAFRVARGKTVDLVRNLTEEQLARRGTFGEYGAITLRSLIHYLASHDLQHLACMEWLLGNLSAETAVPSRAPLVCSTIRDGSR